MKKRTVPLSTEESEDREPDIEKADWFLNMPPNLRSSCKIERGTYVIKMHREVYEQLDHYERVIVNTGVVLSERWDRVLLGKVFDHLEEKDGVEDLDRVIDILLMAWWNLVARAVGLEALRGGKSLRKKRASVNKALTKAQKKLTEFLDAASEREEAEEANKLRSALDVFSKSCEESPLLDDIPGEQILSSEAAKEGLQLGGHLTKPFRIDSVHSELEKEGIIAKHRDALMAGFNLTGGALSLRGLLRKKRFRPFPRPKEIE